MGAIAMSFRHCHAEETEWWEVKLPISHDPRALLEEVALILKQSDLDIIYSITADGSDDSTATYTVILHG
jgi:hypothetical protein